MIETEFSISQLEDTLRPLLDFDKVLHFEKIQSLWSDYGAILRVSLSESIHKSIILKHIAPPQIQHHPRGWNSDIGHQRKLRSYEVESNWYSKYNHLLDQDCRSPKLLGYQKQAGITVLILEDLSEAGFPNLYRDLHPDQIKKCLVWLAHFHARFLSIAPNQLWSIGTYWHLDTRLNELNAMENGPLKAAAKHLDKALNQAQFKTLVHGDAKYANFCFSNKDEVAAVDFQYTGGGCGIKDVIYLLSCIEGGIATQEKEDEYLQHYFNALKSRINDHGQDIDSDSMEEEWRHLYPIAWADFERFLAGWAPGHWKSTNYARSQVEKALKQIGR